MPLKFANYSALSRAMKQASEDIKEARRHFDAQRAAAKVEQSRHQAQ